MWMLKQLRVLKFFFTSQVSEEVAFNINDHSFIDSIIWKPDFPWFISFPRTGSHWVRMMMELYFEKPSLVEIYYYKEAKEFTCYHRHDIELTIGGCTNVLYLYRDPVDTVYSQLKYHKEDVNDKERIRYWTEIYGKHLAKWLYEEGFTTKKTVITYEGLKKDLFNEFKKICDHFDVPFDRKKLEVVAAQVNKGTLNKRTSHDEQVVNLSYDYDNARSVFRNQYAKDIMNTIQAVHPDIKKLF